MSDEKIAIVTGGNKGIGYATVKELCEKYAGKIYLTARDAERGHEAVLKLQELGFNPSFHQLDIDNQNSVDKFKEYISKNYGGIDILINNAGIAFKIAATESFAVQAEVTVNTNYFGTLRVSEALIPLLRQNARLINVSSSLGHLSKIPSAELKNKLSDPNLTIEKLTDLINEFVTATKEDKDISSSWGTSSYNVSKVGVCALTRIYQKIFDNETPST